MRKIIIFILLFLAAVFPNSTFAIYDPTSVPNNKFGIHITQEADLELASQIVNSSGGDWGWATLVIRKDERDLRRWQNVFNSMRRLHLIPIVRIASIQQNSGWERLSLGEIDGWVDFLSSLNWPTQNMYVIVGNEPNHAKEWGAEVSAESYTQYLSTFIEKARSKSDDFFILPAALDFSAQSDGASLDAAQFTGQMLEDQPDIFEKVDAWNSHSYPNPAFSGSEKAVGRGTISSFRWEVAYLKSLGVDKNLPVFITETGWAHDMEEDQNGNLGTSDIGQKFRYAFENVWAEDMVVAVTPFILTYQDPPFDIFSWKKKDGNLYPFVEEVKGIPKEDGQPIQKTSGEIITAFIPPFVKAGDSFTAAILAKNTGQSIWNEEELVLIQDVENRIEVIRVISSPQIEPFDKKMILFEAKAPDDKGQISGNIALYKNNKVISNYFPYQTNSYIFSNLMYQLATIRNSLASAFWIFRVNILGH